MNPEAFGISDMADYAERVLRVLDLQATYFRTQSRSDLVAAKQAELDLRKLTTRILEVTGRREPKPPAYKQLTFADADGPTGLPD